MNKHRQESRNSPIQSNVKLKMTKCVHSLNFKFASGFHKKIKNKNKAASG